MWVLLSLPANLPNKMALLHQNQQFEFAALTICNFSCWAVKFSNQNKGRKKKKQNCESGKFKLLNSVEQSHFIWKVCWQTEQYIFLNLHFIHVRDISNCIWIILQAVLNLHSNSEDSKKDNSPSETLPKIAFCSGLAPSSGEILN